MISKRLLLTLLCGALSPTLAVAQTPDPAVASIETLDNGILEAMKSAKSVNTDGRFRKLFPVVERTFDLPTMTRFAVGGAWSSYSDADQAALIKAFGRLSAASLAKNFDSYGGEQFKINPEVQTRGVDKIVRTQIVPVSGAPTDLNYRMRQSGGTWKVIDVYYGSISQLTAQRSDFASTAVAGGASNLVQKITARSDKLLK